MHAILTMDVSLHVQIGILAQHLALSQNCIEKAKGNMYQQLIPMYILSILCIVVCARVAGVAPLFVVMLPACLDSKLCEGGTYADDVS